MHFRHWRWKNLSVRDKGFVVIATPVAALVLTALVFHLVHLRAARAQQAVAGSFQLEVRLQTVLTLMVDAETSVRGYLLMRDRAFLEPFERTEGQLTPQFASLRGAAMDAWQREQLAVLERLCQDRLAILRGFFADPASISPDALWEGKRRMDGVRNAMQLIIDAEERRLADRRSRAAGAERLTLALVYAGAVLGVAAGVLGALLFTNELQATDRVLKSRLDQIAIANKELEAFSYSVSHDLRAPLRHVVGFAALLEKHAEGRIDDTAKRYLRVIMDAAARMGLLVDDLLAFSRMAKAEVAAAEVDLDALVADVVGEASADAGTRDVAWTLHPLPRVRGDLAMLRVVLMNLVSNALKYTGTRGRAEIEIGGRVDSMGDTVLYVRDNGVGFDMAYADKLFGVFQRLHSADQFEGTGIGLASVRRIVHRHGGNAWAEGVLDGGATFYVSLPGPRGAEE